MSASFSSIIYHFASTSVANAFFFKSWQKSAVHKRKANMALGIVLWRLKKKIILKSHTFLSSPLTSKHLAFPLTGVSTFEVPALLKKFVSKDATSATAILKLSWQPSTSSNTVRIKIGGKERNLQLTWHPSQGKQNISFSKQLSTSLSSMLSFWSLEHVQPKITWLKSSHNPEC